MVQSNVQRIGEYPEESIAQSERRPEMEHAKALVMMPIATVGARDS